VAQHRGDVVDQGLGGFLAVFRLVFGEDGHEGLRERALGEQAPQQVGQAERDVEGIGEIRGAEGGGKQAFTQQSGDARHHGHAGDGGEGLEQIHGPRL